MFILIKFLTEPDGFSIFSKKTCTKDKGEYSTFKKAIARCKSLPSCFIVGQGCDDMNEVGLCSAWSDIHDDSDGNSCVYASPGAIYILYEYIVLTIIYQNLV